MSEIWGGHKLFGSARILTRIAKGQSSDDSTRERDKMMNPHLVNVIENEEWFPSKMPDQKAGDLVYEGTVIQKISRSQFVRHSRRPSVYDLYVGGEESKKQFNNARDAAEFYLRWELFCGKSWEIGLKRPGESGLDGT